MKLDCYTVYYTQESVVKTYKCVPNEGSISANKAIREIEGWSPILSFPSYTCMAESSEEAISKSLHDLFTYQSELYAIEVDTNVEVNVTLVTEE